MAARVVAVSDPRSAVEGADVIATATRAADPLFDGRWLADGAHVNAAGSNVADHRELDDETIRRASTIVVDAPEQAPWEAGTLLQARANGALDWDRVVPLADLVAGRAAGRRSPDDVTIFVSLGMGIEDVAAGMLAYERAATAGLGVPVELSPPS